MSLTAILKTIQESVFPEIEGTAWKSPVGLAEMLAAITDIRCTANEFQAKALRLSPEQAETLITATLHRTMAYGSEVLPLVEARRLSQEFVRAAGPDAEFLSNCIVTDEVSGVGGWQFKVTTHTFESVLCCLGKSESALLFAIDED